MKWDSVIAPILHDVNRELSSKRLKTIGAKATRLLRELSSEDVRTAIVAGNIPRNKLDAQSVAMGLYPLEGDLVNYVLTQESPQANQDPEEFFGPLLEDFDKILSIPREYLLYASDQPSDAEVAEVLGVKFIGVAANRAARLSFNDHRQPWVADINRISKII